MGIYKFGNNTYPRRIRRRSNLGHIFRGKKFVLWARKYSIVIPEEPCKLRNKNISKLFCFGFGVVSYLLTFHNVGYLLVLLLLVLDGFYGNLGFQVKF
jgi:hypothetical protein